MRVYLQDIFESTKASVLGGSPNLGGWFYKKTIGDPSQRKILEAAMSNRQFRNLERFSDILRRTGLIFGKESATATRQEMLKEMKAASGSKLIDYFRNLEATRPATWMGGDQFLLWMQDTLFNRYNKELSEAMLSDKASARLRHIWQLSPKSKERIRQLGTFLGLVIGGEFKRKVEQ